jgi:hypothetical protein
MDREKFSTTTPYKLHAALEKKGPIILEFVAELIRDTISNIVRERYSPEETDQILNEAFSKMPLQAGSIALGFGTQSILNAFCQVSAIKEEFAEFLEQVPEHKDI